MSTATLMLQRRRPRLFCAVCCMLVLTAACGGGGNRSAPSSPSASAPESTATAPSVAITIQGHRYREKVTVSSGAQVAVINKDLTTHTVTSDSAGLFDVSVGPSGRATFTAPTAPGSYPYHCSRHPSMHGELIVA